MCFHLTDDPIRIVCDTNILSLSGGEIKRNYRELFSDVSAGEVGRKSTIYRRTNRNQTESNYHQEISLDNWRELDADASEIDLIRRLS